VGILEHADAPGGPVLFGGHTKTRGVSRSATFGHDCSHSECTDCLEQGKSMHRSSTMPVDVPVSTAASVTSGLGSISSSFKLPFRLVVSFRFNVVTDYQSMSSLLRSFPTYYVYLCYRTIQTYVFWNKGDSLGEGSKFITIKHTVIYWWKQN
jgi:hypothetical protein